MLPDKFVQPVKLQVFDSSGRKIPVRRYELSYDMPADCQRVNVELDLEISLPDTPVSSGVYLAKVNRSHTLHDVVRTWAEMSAEEQNA